MRQECSETRSVAGLDSILKNCEKISDKGLNICLSQAK